MIRWELRGEREDYGLLFVQTVLDVDTGDRGWAMMGKRFES